MLVVIQLYGERTDIGGVESQYCTLRAQMKHTYCWKSLVARFQIGTGILNISERISLKASTVTYLFRFYHSNDTP